MSKKTPLDVPTPPSLDELFVRIAKKDTPLERKQLVSRLRAERLEWHQKQEKKRDAKEA